MQLNCLQGFNIFRMHLLVLLLQLPGRQSWPYSEIAALAQEGTGRNALNTKLFPPLIRSSSLLLQVTCAISSQSSLLDPLDYPHWSLFTPSDDSSLKIINRSFRYAAPHFWNKLPPTLRVAYHFDPSSLPSSSPSSCCDPGPLVDLFPGVIHFRTFLFLKSFPP